MIELYVDMHTHAHLHTHTNSGLCSFTQIAFLEPFLDDPHAQDKLGKVERFLLGLLTIPAYSERLRVMRTKKWFENLKTDYQPIFHLLHVSMKGEGSNSNSCLL